MNKELTINNLKANGSYKSDRVLAYAKDMATNIVPSVAQREYRDALYKFLCEKGVVRDGFKLRKTSRGMHSDIRAFKTIITKNGLWDEWNRRASDA